MENNRITGTHTHTHTLSVETKDMQFWNVCRVDSAEEPLAAAVVFGFWLFAIHCVYVCAVHSGYAAQDNGWNCLNPAIFRIS